MQIDIEQLAIKDRENNIFRHYEDFYKILNIDKTELLKLDEKNPLIEDVDIKLKNLKKSLFSKDNYQYYFFVDNLLNIIKLADFKQRHKKVFYYIGIEQMSKTDLTNVLECSINNINNIVAEINDKLYNFAYYNNDNAYYLEKNIILTIHGKIKNTKAKNKKITKEKNNINLTNIIIELSKQVIKGYEIYFKNKLEIE